jgi:hypothetical protein
MNSSLIATREIIDVPTDVPIRPIRTSHPIAGHALVAVIVSLAVAGIIWQQLVHTPWGMPGHRGLFWLSTLIAARWTIDRPGTALGVAAASSAGILLLDPTMGVHVATYLIAGFLVDLAATANLIRRHPWTMVLLAPLILLVNLINPFLHNLTRSALPTVISGMGFYVQGHLLWGTAAGLLGVGVGTLGKSLLRTSRRPDPHAINPTVR